jgi:hypothetical protein
MKKRLMLVLCVLLGCIYGHAQTGGLYTVSIRVQHDDSVLHCDCAQSYDDNASTDNSCNVIEQVMVNIYRDTNLVKTMYVNHSDYSTIVSVPQGKYKVTFVAKNYAPASISMEVAGANPKNGVYPLAGCATHFVNDGDSYFICVLMHGQGKKSGVKIIPK